MKIFYHVSTEYEKNIEVFVPGLDFSKAKGENTEIPRVCVSEDIMGCIKATPMSGYFTGEILDFDFICPYSYMEMMHHIPRLKTEGFLAKVYVFNVDDSVKIMSNEDIIKNKYVPDALNTGECWIMEPIKPSDYFYILCSEKSFLNNTYYDLGKNYDDAIPAIDIFMKERESV